MPDSITSESMQKRDSKNLKKYLITWGVKNLLQISFVQHKQKQNSSEEVFSERIMQTKHTMRFEKRFVKPSQNSEELCQRIFQQQIVSSRQKKELPKILLSNSTNDHSNNPYMIQAH
jgi:uncharacterized protein (UPF0210 family)